MDEIEFLASLTACPRCSSHQTPIFAHGGGGLYWTVRATCPNCALARELRFKTLRDPQKSHPLYELADEKEPSQIISRQQFHDELERLLALLPSEPFTMPALEWRIAAKEMDRARVCVGELLKFDNSRETSADLRRIADELEQLSLRFDDDAPRVWALEKAAAPVVPASRGAIDRDTLRAHATWLANGRVGTGQLDVAHLKKHQVGLGSVQMSYAQMDEVVFDDCNLSWIDLDHAKLLRARFDACNLNAANTKAARLEDCAFVACSMNQADFNDAAVVQTTFRETYITRSIWKDARLQRCTFDHASVMDSRLDGAHFIDCNFHDVNLMLKPAGKRPTVVAGQPAEVFEHSFADLCTTNGTRFENCTFRSTNWQGRNLDGATFVNCTFEASRGKPSSMSGVVVEGGSHTLQQLSEMFDREPQ